MRGDRQDYTRNTSVTHLISHKLSDPPFITNKIHNPRWNIEEIRDPLCVQNPPIREKCPQNAKFESLFLAKSVDSRTNSPPPLSARDEIRHFINRNSISARSIGLKFAM